MKYTITKKDNINILNYYNESIPDNNKQLKEKAENILNKKLCSCIKKVNEQTKDEFRSIGICTKTIFNKRNMKRGKFTCKKTRKPQFKFTKTKKNISFVSKK
jgi:hypothetical protein